MNVAAQQMHLNANTAHPGHKPGKGLLVTGGVLSIIISSIYLLVFGWLASVVGSAASKVPMFGGALGNAAAIFGLVAFVALAGIVTSSLQFTGKAWAAIATGSIQALFALIFAYGIMKGAPAGVPGFCLLLSGLGATFSFLGLKQAKALTEWKARA